MDKGSLNIFGLKKFSVDQLLKEKPKQLPFLEPIEEEPGNFQLNVNHVNIFDVRTHELIYGTCWVIIRFYNKNKKLLATLSAFGSGDGKEDEYFYAGYGKIISGTSMRILNKDIEEFDNSDIAI
jgi:hypothetical protein